MFSRSLALVATAVAFMIAFIFYVLLTFIGGFNTMYLNAVLAAIIILVLFEPLRERSHRRLARHEIPQPRRQAPGHAFAHQRRLVPGSGLFEAARIGTGAGDVERDTGGGIRLQTVMISPTQRAAIINGVVVKLGEKYGDAVLVRVTESGVVLRSGDVHRVLRIHPDVEMRARSMGQ